MVAQPGTTAFAEEKRKFYVRCYHRSRFKKLEFTRDSYSPGDRVQADVSAFSVDGGAAVTAQITATATVDGVVVHEAAYPPGVRGGAVQSALPKSFSMA